MENEDLYLELLCQVLHSQFSVEEQINHLSSIFGVSPETSRNLIDKCSTRKKSDSKLNVEVVAARNLNLKNSFVEIFIVLLVDSNLDLKYKSSVLVGDTNPIWNEHFSL